MQIGDLIECEHCPPEIVTETTENGQTIETTRPVRHPIIGFAEHRVVPQMTHVGTPDSTTEPIVEPRTTTFYDGRPICACPTLYTDQVHESARMRLVGTMTRG